MTYDFRGRTLQLGARVMYATLSSDNGAFLARGYIRAIRGNTSLVSRTPEGTTHSVRNDALYQEVLA